MMQANVTPNRHPADVKRLLNDALQSKGLSIRAWVKQNLITYFTPLSLSYTEK
jgi:hypothetical protein